MPLQSELEASLHLGTSFISTISPVLRTQQTVHELHPPRRGLHIGSDQLHPLTIDSKDLFDSFAQTQAGLSNDLGFANNFIWMSRMSGFYALIDDCFCLFALNGNVLSLLLPPLGDVGKQAGALKHCFDIMDTYNQGSGDSAVEFVDQEFVLNHGLEKGSDHWSLEPQFDDYVYLTCDLIELSGNAYKNKRNEINQFLRAYPSYRLERLESRHHEGIRDLLGLWVSDRLRGMQGASVVSFIETVELERMSIERALHHYDALGLEGLCLVIDGRIEGFTLGERITGKVASILIEKTNFAITGAAQFLFREFSRSLSDCPYTNVGDDLGLENLRRVKMSYRPALFGEKMTLRRNAPA